MVTWTRAAARVKLPACGPSMRARLLTGWRSVGPLSRLSGPSSPRRIYSGCAKAWKPSIHTADPPPKGLDKRAQYLREQVEKCHGDLSTYSLTMLHKLRIELAETLRELREPLQLTLFRHHLPSVPLPGRRSP